MTTVFTLGGVFSGPNNNLPNQLQGLITTGNTCIQVPYNNFGMFLNTVQQGAAMLNTYLNAGTGKMVVFGHALGAVICNYWLSNYVTGPVATTTISPANLSFVWIGNPVSLYGGALGPATNALWPNWFTNITVPANTPYTVLDIKRQYDGWTDWPTGTMNATAQANAFAGQGVVHPNYQNVSPQPNAPGNVSYTPLVGGSAGNITYIWSMTVPVPLYGTTASPDLDQAVRPTIESAYNRPVYVPSPFDLNASSPVLAVRVVIPAPTVATPYVGPIAPPVLGVSGNVSAPNIQMIAPAPAGMVTASIPAPTLQPQISSPPAVVTATIPTPTIVNS